MEALPIWLYCVAGVLGGMLLLLWMRQGSAAAAVHFEMELPSQWAAELTQQILEAEGTDSQLGRRGGAWICRVTLHELFDAARCERLRAHFHQVARGRGGDCPSFAVVTGKRRKVYDAGRRSD